MSDAQSLFDRAVEALKRAAAKSNNGERGLLREEAVRLHRLALEAEAADRTEPS